MGHEASVCYQNRTTQFAIDSKHPLGPRRFQIGSAVNAHALGSSNLRTVCAVERSTLEIASASRTLVRHIRHSYRRKVDHEQIALFDAGRVFGTCALDRADPAGMA